MAHGRRISIAAAIRHATEVQTIASGRSIRELARLQRMYGKGRWRKLKGITRVLLPDGSLATVELHWYEAHGIGRREPKIKRILATEP